MTLGGTVIVPILKLGIVSSERLGKLSKVLERESSREGSRTLACTQVQHLCPTLNCTYTTSIQLVKGHQ